MSRELRDEARQRRRERELLERKREEFAGDLRAIAVTVEGRRFLRWLLEQGDIFRGGYQPGESGAYAAGKKAAALDLLDRLRRSLPHDAFTAIVLPEADSAATAPPESAGGEEIGSTGETYA